MNRLSVKRGWALAASDPLGTGVATGRGLGDVPSCEPHGELMQELLCTEHGLTPCLPDQNNAPTPPISSVLLHPIVTDFFFYHQARICIIRDGF